MPQRCVGALSALWDKRTCGHAHQAMDRIFREGADGE